ncbi:hypothetical protein B9Z65_5559 [Elsinoe australis]|uniref:Uncharacterized protein n=1 Tax=Elsinoe australis TaxID=40998 RepID=A0A2P7ZJJ5_9PEZI|nr:hypothetical protein B9Z65_5559 [Elsinoe australis]
METKQHSPLIESPYVRSLLAGGVAGTTVDTSLFPLDTLKTRLQSAEGFLKAGGFRGVYNGLGSAVVGSAPGAALFFVSYDGIKRVLSSPASGQPRSKLYDAGVHSLAASVGEIAACAVRVPTEVVKQRAQAGQYPSSLSALRSILDLRRTKGFGAMWMDLYRGWSITILREVPFTVIQFPLWEGMKRWSVSRRSRSTTVPDGAKEQATALESALFGSVSGAVAAGLTTPLDVLKTRLMLGREKQNVVTLARRIFKDEGARVFFRGIGPRTMWISIGGAVFLGSYQFASNFLA